MKPSSTHCSQPELRRTFVTPAPEDAGKTWPQLGIFLPDGTYELRDPRTPRPWQNLLTNDEYLLSLSQLGTGFSTYKGIFANRVTQSYLEQEFDDKRSGRFFYLRDQADGDIFSPMVYPTHSSPDGYQDYCCRFAPGRLSWSVRRGGVKLTLETLVCLEENTELHRLTVTDLEGKPRAYDAFLYLEWCFAGAPQDQGFAIDTGFLGEENVLWADVRIHPERRMHQTGFITASQPILDYDCRRLAFEGPMGTINSPDAVRRGHCLNSGGPIIGTTTGAIHVKLAVPAHGTAAVLFAVGVAENRAAIPARLPRFADPAQFDAEKAAVVAHWERALAIQQLPTSAGDELGLFMNSWLKYQVIMTARWTRWAAKKGYRDVLQDAAGLRLIDPPAARRMIVAALRHQRSDGHAPRCWDETPWGAHSWIDARDCPYWLAYGIDAYLRESGDLALLAEKLPFIDDSTPVTVWEHLRRMVDFLWEKRGSRGLCLFGESDWNDSLNLAGVEGRGESVWLTQAFAHGLLLLADLAQVAGQPEPTPGFLARHAILAEALNKHGWDGGWYRRGYTDSGRVIGSASCRDGGQIYLLPQAWAVLSRTAPPERQEQACQAAERLLESEFGPMLYTPSYQTYDPEIGRLSVGGAEKDSVYVHAALFKIQADLMRGEADRAWEMIQKVVPASGVIPAARSGAEPFCCVNAYAGENWAWPGWSYIGWWSATPSWLLQAVVEWLYGARAEHDGLRIDPRLPKAWPGAELVRHFRGAAYHIRIRKPKGVAWNECDAVVTMDGELVPGGLLPPAPAGRRVEVACVLTPIAPATLWPDEVERSHQRRPPRAEALPIDLVAAPQS